MAEPNRIYLFLGVFFLFLPYLFVSLSLPLIWKIESTAEPEPNATLCVFVSNKLRKQIQWKTIRNSVSKLNNSQLICNKTAVTIRCDALAHTHTQIHADNFNHQNDQPPGRTKELTITEMKTYTKLSKKITLQHARFHASKQNVIWLMLVFFFLR